MRLRFSDGTCNVGDHSSGENWPLELSAESTVHSRKTVQQLRFLYYFSIFFWLCFAVDRSVVCLSSINGWSRLDHNSILLNSVCVCVCVCACVCVCVCVCARVRACSKLSHLYEIRGEIFAFRCMHGLVLL